MTPDDIRRATTRITVAYLNNHEMTNDRLSLLVEAIAGALVQREEKAAPPSVTIYRKVSRRRKAVLPDEGRIEHEDQLDLLGGVDREASEIPPVDGSEGIP